MRAFPIGSYLKFVNNEICADVKLSVLLGNLVHGMFDVSRGNVTLIHQPRGIWTDDASRSFPFGELVH